MTATLSPYFWAVQGIGIAGLVCTVIAFLSRSRDRFLFIQEFGALLFMAHFFALGALTGAAMNLVVILRNIVYRSKHARLWAQHATWPYLFAALSAALLLYTWQGWISLFPVAGVAIASFGLWHDRTDVIRRFMLASALVWLPYLAVMQSYPGVINQLVLAGALLFGIAHIDHDHAERRP